MVFGANDPLSSVGQCKPGELYNISSIDDLRRLKGELECVFTTGCKIEKEQKVPTGNLMGDMLTNPLILDTFSKTVGTAYRGEFVFPYECASSDGYIGITDIFGGITATGTFEVWNSADDPNKFPVLAEGQGPFGYDIDYLVMDYTINPLDLCTIDENKNPVNSLMPLKSSPPPASAYVSVGTIVGFTPADNPIYLVKAFAPTLNSVYSPELGKMEVERGNVFFYAFIANNMDSSDIVCTTETDMEFDYDYKTVVDIHLGGFAAFPKAFNEKFNNTRATVRDYVGQFVKVGLRQ